MRKLWKNYELGESDLKTYLLILLNQTLSYHLETSLVITQLLKNTHLRINKFKETSIEILFKYIFSHKTYSSMTTLIS